MLVSIYHSAESFITPENLSAHIDREFVRNQTVSYTTIDSKHGDLAKDLAQRRSMPRIALTSLKQDDIHSPDMYTDGPQQARFFRRHRAVKAALYGVDEQTMKVGLESAEENQSARGVVDEIQAQARSRHEQDQ